MRRVVVVLLTLLPVAVIALLYAFLGPSSVLSLPSLSAPSGSGSHTHRISLLEQEAAHLKEVLASQRRSKAGGGAVASNPKNDANVTIDLFKYLGLQSYFAGVSWDPLVCFPPPKTIWPTINEETTKKLEVTIAELLRSMLAKVKGVDPQAIDPSKPYHQLFDKDDESVYEWDPHFPVWRRNILLVLAPYLVNPHQLMHLKCNNTIDRKVWPADLGPSVDCSRELNETQMIEQLGYYAMPYESINSIARGFVGSGICSMQLRDHAPSYAHWLRGGRVHKRSWATFAVDSLDQDAVLLLFDLLYERMAVFTQQYWLGVITMQNPFDLYSIQDILYQTRPTLMIETGTANGGSALLWASIMDLAEMNTSRIITVDTVAPKWERGVTTWGGQAREDPTRHRLWLRYVTFIQGSTTDQPTIDKIKQEAAGQKVMVLLDSHHTSDHVQQEMDLYCPLVSVGLYCIVEDTKMSRWSSDGPLEAVKRFMKGPHGRNFEMVRERELLYSHHVMGYLKRIS